MLLKGIFFATGEADNDVTSKQLGNTTTDISVCFAWISCAPAGSKAGSMLSYQPYRICRLHIYT